MEGKIKFAMLPPLNRLIEDQKERSSGNSRAKDFQPTDRSSGSLFKVKEVSNFQKFRNNVIPE